MSELALVVGQRLDVARLDTAKPLEEVFKPYQTTLEKWETKAITLAVTDISQKTEMAQARLARLEIKDARVAMEKARKGLVEDMKARTSRIDATARAIRDKMEQLEEEFRASEEFATRFEEKRRAELKAARENELKQFLDSPSLIITDLSTLSDEVFAGMVADAKLLQQTKREAAEKLEAEKKAAAEAARAEQQRIAAENERLKAEAAERERLAGIESERIEAERAQERKAAEEEQKRQARAAEEERQLQKAKHDEEQRIAKAETDRLAAELAQRQKVDAEKAAAEKVQQEEQEKARHAAATAPDAEKLKAFANVISNLVIPDIASAEIRQLMDTQRNKFAAWVLTLIKKL